MKSIKKKIVALFSVAFLLMSNTCLTANASTDNYYFNSFGIQPPNGNWSSLPPLYKETDSSIYLYLSSAIYPVYVKAEQGNNNITLNGNGQQVSYVTCWQGIEYRIKNSANVPGYVNLSFKSTQQYTGFTITGCWSPDWINEPGHTYSFAY